MIIEDITGRYIRLSSERWKHIAAQHPSITLDLIKDTLITPTTMKGSVHDPQKVQLYYRFLKDQQRYIFVAVKYLNGHGFVITAYYMRKIR